MTVAAQQEIPRFKSGVDVVQFTVTVLDTDRHPITGLTASDFEVLVDGQPRPLAAFAAVTLPDGAAAVAAIPPVAPDVLTNQLPSEGRLVVIVMDRSMRDEDQRTAHAIANAAIDRLGPDDLGAVVYTGTVSRKISQGLTADRARLHASANLLTIGELHAAPATPSLATAIATRGAPQKIDQLERAAPLASEERSGECNCGGCVLDSLTALARSLAGAMGRQKSILFIGSDLAIASTVGSQGGYCASFIYPARDKLTRALDAANVTFHVVDPHGLDPLEGISFRQQSLAVLPDETGGRTVINNNKPEDKIGAIFDESRAYYVLAVAREAATTKDGSHQIKINVKRVGATVRGRNLSFAPDPKAEAARAPTVAAGALNELLPGGNFPLRMNLASEFLPDGSAAIRVLLGADATVAGKLDVLVRAFDRVFTPVGEPLKQRLDVPPAAVAGSAEFQWSSVLTPPPGDYEVRAAVASADGKHVANVMGYVDVPDAKHADLALSGIVIKSGKTPTLARTFAPGEAVGLSFQVARKDARSAVIVRYALHDDVGQALATIEVPHERAVRVGKTIDGYDLGVRLPSAPGRYVATIEASDGHRVVRRPVLLAVH